MPRPTRRRQQWERPTPPETPHPPRLRMNDLLHPVGVVEAKPSLPASSTRIHPHAESIRATSSDSPGVIRRWPPLPASPDGAQQRPAPPTTAKPASSATQQESGDAVDRQLPAGDGPLPSAHYLDSRLKRCRNLKTSRRVRVTSQFILPRRSWSRSDRAPVRGPFQYRQNRVTLRRHRPGHDGQGIDGRAASWWRYVPTR